MTPDNIRAALGVIDPTKLPGAITDDQIVCEGAKFHSPTPLAVRPYDLVGAVAYVVYGVHSQNPHPDRVWLCGTCVDNLKVLLLIVHAHAGSLPWEVRREFGNRIRSIGYRAWAHYVSDCPAPALPESA